MGRLSGLERELESTEVDDRGFWQKADDWYSEPKGIERWGDGKVYELLGVKPYKRVLTDLMIKINGGKKPHRVSNYFIWDTSKKGLKEFEERTRFNEGIHISGGLLTGAFAALTFTILDYPILGTIPALLTVTQAYCIMIQRYNRVRIYNILERIEQTDARPL